MKSSIIGRGAASALGRTLLLCTSLTIPALVGALPAQASQQDVQSFFKKGYNFCDAKLLANYWGIGTYEAKEAGGEKIRNHNEPILRGIMQTARTQSRCDFGDTGVSYEDADALAGYWGLQVNQSKNKIAKLYTRGNSRQVRQALKQARGGGE